MPFMRKRCFIGTRFTATETNSKQPFNYRVKKKKKSFEKTKSHFWSYLTHTHAYTLSPYQSLTKCWRAWTHSSTVFNLWPKKGLKRSDKWLLHVIYHVVFKQQVCPLCTCVICRWSFFSLQKATWREAAVAHCRACATPQKPALGCKCKNCTLVLVRLSGYHENSRQTDRLQQFGKNLLLLELVTADKVCMVCVNGFC